MAKDCSTWNQNVGASNGAALKLCLQRVWPSHGGRICGWMASRTSQARLNASCRDKQSYTYAYLHKCTHIYIIIYVMDVQTIPGGLQ